MQYPLETGPIPTGSANQSVNMPAGAQGVRYRPAYAALERAPYDAVSKRMDDGLVYLVNPKGETVSGPAGGGGAHRHEEGEGFIREILTDKGRVVRWKDD